MLKHVQTNRLTINPETFTSHIYISYSITKKQVNVFECILGKMLFNHVCKDTKTYNINVLPASKRFFSFMYELYISLLCILI